jgi:hypothetical protein
MPKPRLLSASFMLCSTKSIWSLRLAPFGAEAVGHFAANDANVCQVPLITHDNSLLTYVKMKLFFIAKPAGAGRGYFARARQIASMALKALRRAV